ncbi:hypothetical protein AL532_06020 [Pseudomonas monteilii]|uniref:Uncharacterized protein n=2 Tax=Pseudomonas TaxID=286 RepID=A0A6G6USY0_9PSED|nr:MULTISPECIES: hypothetical protein [Pseudomonas]AVH35890.1 hypothetical protein AL532_06020 [Pseudomonas monteilii]MBA6139366.1 hypothetical protein [Pseudomonas monteilii]MBV4515860.1 hypothetical protein [Pseudomonas kurunegalensis]MBZ3664939.1 hypothetical protein [Pseudomonas monteilii]MBZ3670284.1 hypothetical protein [Pseudomonas monteilii]
MKHFYLVTLYGYDEEGDLFYATGFAKCKLQLITKADILAIMEKAKNDSEFSLNLHSVSYLGHMTEDAFEHLRSMEDE